MRRAACLLAVSLLWAVNAVAEVYRWTDENGRVHFTQDLGQVPPRHRRQAEQAAAQPERSRVQTYSTGAASPGDPERGVSAPSEARDDGRIYRIPVQRAGTSMLVPVRLNGRVTAPFLIDTGASDVLVPKAVADRLGLASGSEARTKRYSTANGIVEHPVVMLSSVSLGGATVEDVPASVSPHMEVGLLGLSFFNHFTYNVDAASGIVTLQRNRLASSGQIRGGRSQAQWQAEYASLRARIARTETEHAEKSTHKTRERGRLQQQLAGLQRQLAMLDEEADRAHVPMAWRR